MKASELKSIIRNLIKEERTLLNEEDRKFYATPEHVEKSIKDAFDKQMKKFKPLAKKGYLTFNETERMFTTFGHGTGWTSVDKSKQRELRKKYGTPEEQDGAKK